MELSELIKMSDEELKQSMLIAIKNAPNRKEIDSSPNKVKNGAEFIRKIQSNKDNGNLTVKLSKVFDEIFDNEEYLDEDNEIIPLNENDFVVDDSKLDITKEKIFAIKF